MREIEEGAGVICQPLTSRASLAPLLAVLGLTLIGLFNSAALGQEVPVAKTVGPFVGTVVDAAGKPVTGVTVWLVSGNPLGDSQIVTQTTTNQQGRFRIAERKWEGSAEGIPFPALVARDPLRRIGGQIQRSRGDAKPSPAEFQLRPREVKEYRGRLVDASGRPIAKASIRPRSFAQTRGEDGDYSNIFFPVEWEKELTAESGADGAFTIREFPSDGALFVSIRAEGYGRLHAELNLEKPATIALARPGTLRGSATGDKNSEAARGIKIRVYGSSARNEPDGSPVQTDSRVWYNESSVTAKDGSFQFENVLPGTCNLQIQLPEALPFYLDDLRPVQVKSAGTTVILLKLKPAVTVRGKVVDLQTGKGVPGVHVYPPLENGRSAGNRAPVATAADGAFTLYAPPGKIRVEIVHTPDDYVPPLLVSNNRNPPKSSFVKVDAAKDVVWPTIKLDRAARLEGIVVDESGKPVPDAEVECFAPRGAYADLAVVPQKTNADGHFTMRGLRPKDTMALRARSARAVSDVVELRPAEATSPVRLTLSPKRVFVIRGICVDSAGRPLPHAKATVSGVWMLGPSGLSFGGGRCETDAVGRFEFPNLWPGFPYQVTIAAKGYEQIESPRLQSGPGQTRDLGRLSLIGVNGSVEGIATDSSDRPLAGVHVFNAGDAPKVLSASTDAAGQFRLEGLRVGPVYLFAEKKGYRFTAVCTQANSTSVKLRLLRSDEPVPPWKPDRPPASLAEEQKVVRRLLTKLWAAPGGKSHWAIEYMARIDAPQAMKWSAELGGGDNGMVRKITAEQIAENDTEEALTLLAQCGDRDAYFSLNSLAERFAASNREKALRFAEEAIQRARRLDQPDRAWMLAGTAQVVTRWGGVEAGRKLAEEAAGMAAKMGTDERQTYYRGLVAAALAPHDLARAIDLLKPSADVYARGRENEKERALARIAGVIAEKDLAKALEIVGRLDKESTQRDNTRMQIAYNLATTRPEDALRVVEGMDTHGATKIKAEALGWMAVVVAPRNPRLARSLIDKSMAVYWDQADGFRSWSNYGGRSAFAAHLVVQAQEIGYPDVGLLIHRLLAMRPTGADSWSPRDVQQTSILTARLLAMVDPQSAKQMLLTAAPNDAMASGVRAVMGDRVLLSAWALADIDHAEKLIESWIEVCRGENVWVDSLIRVMDALTTPRGERARCLLRFEGYWFPGED
jgi:hypothetical protein